MVRVRVRVGIIRVRVSEHHSRVKYSGLQRMRMWRERLTKSPSEWMPRNYSESSVRVPRTRVRVRARASGCRATIVKVVCAFPGLGLGLGPERMDAAQLG